LQGEDFKALFLREVARFVRTVAEALAGWSAAWSPPAQNAARVLAEVLKKARRVRAMGRSS